MNAVDLFESPSTTQGKLYFTLVDADLRFDNTCSRCQAYYINLSRHCKLDATEIQNGLIALGPNLDTPSGQFVGELPASQSGRCVFRTASQLFNRALHPRVRQEILEGRGSYGRPVDPTNNRSMSDCIQFLVRESWANEKWIWRHFDPAAILRSGGGNYFWTADSSEVEQFIRDKTALQALWGPESMRTIGLPFFGPNHPGVPDEDYEGVWRIEISNEPTEFHVPSLWDSNGFIFFMPALVDSPRSGRTVYFSNGEAPRFADGVREWVHPALQLRNCLSGISYVGSAEKVLPPLNCEADLLTLLEHRLT